VVELIWLIQEQSPDIHAVEHAVSSHLIESNTAHRLASYEKFGIFWRYSDMVPNASVIFSRPLFIMMDLLKSHHPANKRAGETFLKCSLKSLAR
jgi:hypothetical protein